MPKQTQNKRVALTLPPEIDDVLTEISQLTATPKTALITELLSDSMPVMLEVCKAIKQVKEGQKQLVIETMGKFLGTASNSLNQAHIDFGGLKGKYDKQ